MAVFKWTFVMFVAAILAAIAMGIPQSFMTPFESYCAEIGGTIVPTQYIAGSGTVYECEVIP